MAEGSTSDIDSLLVDVMRKSQIKKMNEVSRHADAPILNTDALHMPIKNHAFNLYDGMVGDDAEQTSLVDGLTLIEPMNLYNILMQHNAGYPSVSDPNYLLLLDARRRETFDESHIVLAKFAVKTRTGDYDIPYAAEVETKTHVVVYDSLTDRLKVEGKKLKTEAIKLGKLVYLNGSRNPVKLLKGGYMTFSKLYPYLRTNQIIYLPMELDNFHTYPMSILSQKLYLGNWAQGNDAKIQRDLKLTGFINCCRMEKGEPSRDRIGPERDDSIFYKGMFTPVLREASTLHLPGGDDDDNPLLTNAQLLEAIFFIDGQGAVLVFSRRGIGRAAAVCIAYAMYATRSPLKKALQYCKMCNFHSVPRQKFLEQLSAFEEEIFGHRVTQLEF